MKQSNIDCNKVENVIPHWINLSKGVFFMAKRTRTSKIDKSLLIIHLWKLALKNSVFYIFGLTLITLVILLLHPDAGQLTSFACASLIILWEKISNWFIKLLFITVTVVLVAVSWVFLDDLEPVPYVEDIIFLVADLGTVWFILGILSLIVLLMPFFLYGKKNIVSLSLGVYFLTTMIVTLIGNFPMPIMGYGISPIIGYFIAITLHNKIKEISG